MAGNEADPSRGAAMGERDAECRPAARSCCDARNHLKSDALSGKLIRLFAAPSEYERIASLQPDDRAPGLRQRHQHQVDFLLPGLSTAEPWSTCRLFRAVVEVLPVPETHILSAGQD